MRMCRWIAYRGLEIPLAHYVTEPAHSLISQSLNALEATARINGDGFGLGWYGAFREPGLYHEVRPVWSDSNLRHLCRHIRSSLFFAHARAATATPVSHSNCHPFANDGWMFMHNGFIGNWGAVRRPVEDLIPDALYPARIGTTDSEAMFLAILGAGASEEPLIATKQIMLKLKRMVIEEDTQLRFTSALTDGKTIYAFRFAVNDGANTLYYRSNRDGTVIASEPLDADRDLWTPVPENHVLIAEPDRAPEIFPFLAA
jgi:predicted glutamine amidotransferase